LVRIVTVLAKVLNTARFQSTVTVEVARRDAAPEASRLNGLRAAKASLPVAQQDGHSGLPGGIERTGADENGQVQVAVLIEVTHGDVGNPLRIHDGERGAKSSVAIAQIDLDTRNGGVDLHGNQIDNAVIVDVGGQNFKRLGNLGYLCTGCEDRCGLRLDRKRDGQKAKDGKGIPGKWTGTHMRAPVDRVPARERNRATI